MLVVGKERFQVLFFSYGSSEPFTETGEKEMARSARTQAAELWGWVGDAMVTESF